MILMGGTAMIALPENRKFLIQLVCRERNRLQDKSMYRFTLTRTYTPTRAHTLQMLKPLQNSLEKHFDNEAELMCWRKKIK